MSEKITFPESRNGYTKEMVDHYVEKIQGAYDALYKEHDLLNNKYQALMSRGNDQRLLGEVEANTLMRAESLAGDIISQAKAQALQTAKDNEISIQTTWETNERINGKTQKIIRDFCDSMDSFKKDLTELLEELELPSVD